MAGGDQKSFADRSKPPAQSRETYLVFLKMKQSC